MSNLRMTPGGKGVILLLILAVIGGGYFYWHKHKPMAVGADVIVSQGEVATPDAPEPSLPAGDAKKLPLPGDGIAAGSIRGTYYDMGWQSSTGFNLANGGPQTTKGSIFAQMGFSITVERQPDCNVSQAKIAQFCQDYQKNPNTPFVIGTYMGTGIPAALQNIINILKKAGVPEEYHPRGFIMPGASVGEDQVMGARKYKDDPNNLKGAVMVCVPLDGDEDCGFKFAGAFGVMVNPNPKTYDPDKLNLRFVTDYTIAASDYNANVFETRRIVRNGQDTHKDTSVGIDLVATWTPGDVTVHNGPRGSQTVSIISTKEYASIMPAVGITCGKWIQDHPTEAQNLIIGTAICGDQIRSFEDVKRFACGLNAKIYKEETPEYWYKYFNGVKIPVPGKDGLPDSSNHLGGSRVYNLADMANMVGIMIKGMTDNNDIYASVYNTFGALQHKYFPDRLETYPTYDKAFDKGPLFNVVSNHPELLKGRANLPSMEGAMTNRVGNKAWHMEFDLGSAEIAAESDATVDEIFNELVSTPEAKALLVGHTDNTGDNNKNEALSVSRAESVKRRLIQKGLEPNRFFPVEGRGSREPLYENTSEEGRRQNRRVQVTLMTK